MEDGGGGVVGVGCLGGFELVEEEDVVDDALLVGGCFTRSMRAGGGRGSHWCGL